MKKMSKLEELKSELSKVKEIISDRRKKANELKLPGKVYEVALAHGELIDYCEGEHQYSEKGLSINTYINGSYMKVDLGHPSKDVFIAKLYQNYTGEIILYIRGDWENRIEELYREIKELSQRSEISHLQKEINQLKSRWKLGEIA